MNKIRFYWNSLRIWLAWFIAPESAVPHICAMGASGRVVPKYDLDAYVCHQCGRVGCHNFGGADGEECDDCWAVNNKETA